MFPKNKKKKKRKKSQLMQDIAFPKSPRAKDSKLVKQMKDEIDYCEKCGSPFYLEAAHIIEKGMGSARGPDMRENIVIICGPARFQQGCHGAHHRGRIEDDELFKLAARREKISLEECKRRVKVAMGYSAKGAV
jgi:hypothetical protein